MQRHELEFQLTYSILLEQMQHTLMIRIDRLCSCLQLILGTATVTSLVPNAVGGTLVAVLAAIQIVYQPGSQAQAAKQHKAQYFAIRQRAPALDDQQLHDALHALDNGDSDIYGALTHPAWVASSLQLGRPVTQAQCRMSLHQRVLARLAGNLPDIRQLPV